MYIICKLNSFISDRLLVLGDNSMSNGENVSEMEEEDGWYCEPHANHVTQT